MAKTALRLRNKVLSANATGVQVFTTEKFVHSVAIEVLATSSVDEAWVGDSATTTTNKEGRAISKTVPYEVQARMRNGGGGIASLVDLSSIYVAQASGGDVLVTYMEAINE